MFGNLGRYALRAVPTAVALVLVAGFAHATIPDGSGRVDACYKTKGGALRVVDSGAGKVCTTKEHALSLQSSNIIARVRSTGPVDVGENTYTPVPLGSSTWTQQAGEINELYGNFTLRFPGNCEMQVFAVVDGAWGEVSPVFLLNVGSEDARDVQVTVPFAASGSGQIPGTPQVSWSTGDLPFVLFEPQSPTTHNIGLEANAGCEGVKVLDASVDVARIG